MVKKQLSLLPQKVYLMNVTMATNVIDQLQHFTNQLKGFLIGEDEAKTTAGPSAAAATATSSSLASLAPSRAAPTRDLARSGSAIHAKTNLISDEERSIVGWLQMRGERHHLRREEPPPPLSTTCLGLADARWGAETLSASLAVIEYEINALHKQHQGQVSIIYGIYPWGTAFRITHRRLGQCLGLRIFEHAYPPTARGGGEQICGAAFELLPLNCLWGGGAAAEAAMGLTEEWGGGGRSTRQGRSFVHQEDDWQLFPPVTLTTVVNLFLHRLVQ